MPQALRGCVKRVWIVREPVAGGAAYDPPTVPDRSDRGAVAPAGAAAPARPARGPPPHATRPDGRGGKGAGRDPGLPRAKPGGRPRTVNMRETLNPFFYQSRGGASWRMLPHALPPGATVHYYYRRWRLDGTWQRMEE